MAQQKAPPWGAAAGVSRGFTAPRIEHRQARWPHRQALTSSWRLVPHKRNEHRLASEAGLGGLLFGGGRSGGLLDFRTPTQVHRPTSL